MSQGVGSAAPLKLAIVEQRAEILQNVLALAEESRAFEIRVLTTPRPISRFTAPPLVPM